MTKIVNLFVNGEVIGLDYFVSGFLDHTISGMLASLEGVGTIENAQISINEASVLVKVNDGEIPVNPFVSRIMRSTIYGMVSSLKGVGTIDNLQIMIQK